MNFWSKFSKFRKASELCIVPFCGTVIFESIQLACSGILLSFWTCRWILLDSHLCTHNFNQFLFNSVCRSILTFPNLWRACQRRYSRMQWGSLFFAVCWFLWRSRNRKLFDGCETDPNWIAQHAIKEAKLWRKFC